LRTLVLARLLLPEHFGLVAIGTTTVGVALNVSNLGMVPALVQRRDAEPVHYDTAWTVGVLRAVLVTGVIALAAPLLAGAFGEPGATNIVRALALRPLFEALASIQVARLTRDLDFRSLAMIRVPSALLDLVVAVALASRLGVWAMVVGTLGGALAVIGLSYVVAPHRPRLRVDRDAADALVRFGRWVFVSGLLGVASGALIQLVISRNLGVAALGLYALAGKLAFLPYQMASEVVGSVAFPLYARLQADRVAVGEAFRGLLAGMAALLLPMYAIIFYLAPDLVEHVLPGPWQGSASIIQVLAVVGAVGLFGDAVDPLLQGLGYPAKSVAIAALQTGAILVVVQPLASGYGAHGAAASWIPGVLASQILSAYFLVRLVPKPFRALARPMTAVLLASAFAGVFSRALAGSLPGAWGAVLAGALAGLGALWILWFLDRRFGLGFSDGIRRIFPRAEAFLR